MTRAAACSPAVLTALLVLLTSLLLFGCRSSDPPTETKTAGLPAGTIRPPPPAPPSASFTIGPLTVFEDPNLSIPEVALPTTEPLSKAGGPPASGKKNRPRIAIIIDDMGYHRQMGRQFLQLDLNLTYSFLPDAPYTAEQEKTAFQLGRDILVHLPMEPKNTAQNPGGEILSVQDPPQRIKEKMARMLDAVPHAIGANNHMGSRFTEDAGVMQVALGSLRQKSLFFVDSYTTSGSQGIAIARLLGVPVVGRHVFLDNNRERLKICRQIDQLAALAKKQGWAVGIGHPHAATHEALNQCGRKWLREVDIVGIHQLVQ